MSKRSLTYQQSVLKRHHSDSRVTNISKSFTHKMAANPSWHRYVTKLRYTHPLAQLAIGSPGNARGPRGPQR